ncbi:MAG TPA: cytochrome c oxidase assembly protein [Candidatus Baltobacteraceae bacterium]|nr:cytochrome c oxidase assembly protein [Candidatus Baltobacteraceae bacterium]
MTQACLGIAAIVGYLLAVRAYDRRFPHRRFSATRIACFIVGVASIAAVLLPPADALADRWFTAHMFQHLILTLVGPPLVLLGAPLLLCVTLPPTWVARRIARAVRVPAVHAVFSPVTAWLAFVATLWIAHFSPLYEAALQNAWIHGFEHALFAATAFLFWMAVVQIGYAPFPLAFPVRLFFLFFAIPSGAFLGLAIYAAQRALYPHYFVGRSFAQGLLDQHGGGAAMWIGGGLVFFTAFVVTAGVWASHERGEVLA